MRVCRVVLCLAVLALWGSSVVAATSKLSDDVSLSPVVTIEAKGESLADIAGMLQKQSGVRLRVAKAIAEEKATVLVDKKPLWEVMDAIETLFGYQWGLKIYKDERIYELTVPLLLTKQVDERNVRISSLMATKVEGILQSGDKQLPSSDDLKVARDKFLAEISERTSGCASVDAMRVAAVRALLNKSPDSFASGLADGCTLWLDTRSSEAQWAIPSDIAGVLAGSIAGSGIAGYPASAAWDYNPRFVRLAIQPKIGSFCGQASVNLGLKCYVQYEDGRADMKASDLLSVASSVAVDVSLPDRLPHVDASSLLGQPATLTMAELAAEAGTPWQTTAPSNMSLGFNRSDALALLHRKYGLQIVSDHVSERGGVTAAELSAAGRTVAEMMEELAGCPDGSYWGCDGKYLYMLSRDRVGAVERETPNSVLRELRAIYTEQQRFSIYDQARIASLGPTKVAALIRTGRYLGIGDANVCPIHDGILDKIDALRFLGSLNRLQLSGASSGDGLDVSALSSSQVRYLLACVQRSPWDTTDRRDAILVGMYKDGARVDRKGAADLGDIVRVAVQRGVPMMITDQDGNKHEDELEGIAISLIRADGSSTTVGITGWPGPETEQAK